MTLDLDPRGHPIPPRCAWCGHAHAPEDCPDYRQLEPIPDVEHEVETPEPTPEPVNHHWLAGYAQAMEDAWHVECAGIEGTASAGTLAKAREMFRETALRRWTEIEGA